jgi:hypothetical protein
MRPTLQMPNRSRRSASRPGTNSGGASVLALPADHAWLQALVSDPAERVILDQPGYVEHTLRPGLLREQVMYPVGPDVLIDPRPSAKRRAAEDAGATYEVDCGSMLAHPSRAATARANFSGL